MKKLFIVFGTRPEIVKMAPLVREAESHSAFEVVTCATAQHRDLLDQMLGFFGISPKYDLNLMKPNQDLFDITTAGLSKLRDALLKERPDYIAVQGDTTTAFMAALGGFYLKIPVIHNEAGLRTHRKDLPFPEEMNRRLIGRLADFHFAPTERARNNLLREGIQNCHVVGNTGIDSLLWALKERRVKNPFADLYRGKKMVLFTAHRREMFGSAMEAILKAVRDFASENSDFHFIYPVHPNPNVKRLAHEILSGVTNVSLIEPVDYGVLVQLLEDCHLVLSDSAGLQEEAPALGKPMLILREATERPESVDSGGARLVGADPKKILESLNTLKAKDSELYRKMASAHNPYGQGDAAKQILSILSAPMATKLAA